MNRVLLALCVGLCLTSCSALRPTVQLSDPQIVRVPGVTRYVEVDRDLTEPTAEPVAPVPLCVDSEGGFVLCDSQVVTWLLAYRGALAEANADKAAVRSLGEKTESGHD